MRIGVNAAYRLHAGAAAHLCGLLGAWSRSGATSRHEIHVFTRATNLALLSDAVDERVRMHAVPAGLARRLLWEQVRLPRLAERLRLDVLLCPGNFAPLRRTVPVVVVVQTMGPFCPCAGNGLRDRAYFAAVRGLMLRSAARAHGVVFVSNHVRQAFEARTRVVRSVVVPHGRDTTAAPAATGLPDGVREPFVLAVGHLYPYKNYAALVRASAIVRDGSQLVIAGAPVHRAHAAELRSLIGELGIDVLLTGAVPHDQVRTLLDRCRCFVFQTTCESFGLSLLEAVSAGAAVASAAGGPMDEIARDAAIYFDARDPDSIAAALRRLCGDESIRAEMRARSVRRAAELPTWDDTAQATLAFLEGL